jgi:hypothetical protein
VRRYKGPGDYIDQAISLEVIPEGTMMFVTG